MNKRIHLVLILVIIAVLVAGANVLAAPETYNLSLQTTKDDCTTPWNEFARDEVFCLNIVLDNSAGIAAAAFTVSYDSTKLIGPATDAEGLPLNPDDVQSSFPFMHSTTRTHRVNSAEPDKIYLAGAAIETDGGGKDDPSPTVLFTIKLQAKSAAVFGLSDLNLEQTELFNPDAGYGIDVNGDGYYDDGVDTKDSVAILVSAIDNTHPDWGGDLSDDFTDETANVGTPLPATQIMISSCVDDSDIDGLSDCVETNTGVYGGPNNTGTNPQVNDTDDDGLLDGEEINTYNTNPVIADSDQDGTDDGAEVDAGSDPANSNSYVENMVISLQLGFNILPIPAEVKFMPDLRDWLPIIGNSTEIEKVLVYDKDTDQMIELIPGDPNNPSFMLSGGEALIVYAKQAKDVNYSSVLCAGADLYQGVNLVVMACPPDGYTAGDLLTDLTPVNITSIQRFNNETGIFETLGFDANNVIVGNDFSIISGEGYWVNMKQDVMDFNPQ